jgi:acetolactate synthase-1/3 small subunit
MPDSSTPSTVVRNGAAPSDEAGARCHESSAAPADGATRPREVVLELRVRNHPGTMSHITGLFARRAFNLDAILCVPVGDAAVSRVLLLVGEEPRLEQVERQLAKLHDVLSIVHRRELGAATFRWLGEF